MASVLVFSEEEKIKITNGPSKQNHKIFKKSGKVLVIAATIVVLSCGSIFAYNRIIIVNKATTLNHTSNIVDGVVDFYDGGAKVEEGCEYNGDWEIAYGDKTATMSHIKITDLQVFFDGTIREYVADDASSYVSQSLFLIYEDGTKIDAGLKFNGSNYKNGSNGTFNRHYFLQNQIDVKRVVAIEFSGNLINLK